ncbi:MocR-like pyridoxine biosynthesis transcription factor PdxR [Paraburkholderia silvatlantica]|uniref:GntR family transcriptional regulator n=1 Tax=Paraburkholderia silvatlantica TaxID=321895 RepID=A0A2U1AG77_9BURK|nr:PLP-dependent aminotransferase family protein [Paraburkholderia silvatlantica]MBB2928816.1 GntR family transcriptional regulator/MocR family aminotransferase [Paraburkholderia silvatlantica]PVY35399.1 GntR family transcriptional regulator [Paraburkholderia silvatlantica]PXW41041.1 GntR family transcriptional regulator [Paraburkholderia silvatlantica]PYE27507.1 GntR family transcriptional regulator [Paraburkholderia silvatlantica]TDQ98132.1 GntR family transcriptional regulator [Paraburkhold
MRASVLSDWLAQRLDRGSAQPVYRQLHKLLQQAILSRELPAGARVPSSRLLAAELGIARNTVTQVYEQLVLEGYVTSATGRGTFVADTSPDEIVGSTEIGSMPARKNADLPGAVLPAGLVATNSQIVHGAQALATAAAGAIGANRVETAAHPQHPATRTLSARGTRLITGAGVSKRQGGAFMPGVPDVSRFPARVWTRLHNKYWRSLRPDLLTYAPGGGLALLRHVLADYLRTSRSVRCSPEQIIITTGIHQSIDLAVRLLSDPGDTIWTEDPCYWGVRSVLHVSGLNTRPIAVDSEGLNPSAGDFAAPPPRLMLVTPSHQYPLGMVMSLARRRMLLEYARQHQCWIIEDDYDSEFRYGSRPLASLQGLDTAGQVIYVGSFGKTLFPGLRVGYLVAPEALAESFATASAELYREGQLLQQAVLAEFIAEGHFTSHIRKMRALYGQRRQVLLDAVARRYGDALPAMGGDAGLHVVMQLPEGSDDRAVAEAALARNIVVRPLSGYYSSRERANPGLLIGYACVPDEEIGPAFDTLAGAIDTTLPAFV